MESVFLITAVTAAVELLRRLEARDYRAVATILVAAGIGALCGVLGVEGVDVPTGILAGLSASGVVTIASRV